MTEKSSRKSWGLDTTTHHLLLLKEPPKELIELRNSLQLPCNIDVAQKAMQDGRTFEECLGIIAAELDIALDGMYDAVDLCRVLNEALENRMLHKNKPHLRAKGLLDAELLERAEEMELVLRNRGTEDGTIIH